MALILSRFIERLGKIFPERKIIILSQDKVKNYPISPAFQWCVFSLIVGAAGWLSFTTDTYLDYDKDMAAKEAAIHETEAAREKLQEKYAIIQYDLAKLSLNKQDGDTLDDYESFIVQQHIDENVDLSLEDDDNLLLSRLDFLENRVRTLEEYKANFLSTLQERANSEIAAIEKALKITGLDIGTLENALIQRDRDDAPADISQRQEQEEDLKRQGGPYIPEEPFSMEEAELIDNISHLVNLRTLSETMPLSFPIQQARRTSGFGMRTDPITKRRAWHNGVDFAAPYGAKVLATADGVVEFAGRNGGYGRSVDVKHDLGFTTRYGHLRKILVQEGDVVKAGQAIGIQGNSGRSTGTHLHYEVHYRNKALDPGKFLKAGKHVYQE